MPVDKEKWEEEMIASGLMKDRNGYYHWTKKEDVQRVLYIALDALRKKEK